MATAGNLPYLPENFPALEATATKAAAEMPDKLRRRIAATIRGKDHAFSSEFQLDSADSQKSYAISELVDSYQHELDLQRIDPKSVESILFGPNGMIRRRGGGAPAPLMEDIEVGYVDDRLNPVIGPVITSGRNRLLALQILMNAAAPGTRLSDIQLRCTTRKFCNHDDMARRIIQANTEARNMSRAEARERKAGAAGLNTSNRENLIGSLAEVRKVADMATALGGFVKLCAIEQNLNGLTLDQYSSAGVTAFGRLRKANKDLNKQISDDTTKLVAMADTACALLPSLVEQAMADTSRGPRNSKLARLLANEIAKKHHLLIQA